MNLQSIRLYQCVPCSFKTHIEGWESLYLFYCVLMKAERTSVSVTGQLNRQKNDLTEEDIGFFGFAVLVTFEIGFSVFALKIPGFSVLVSTAVFGFSLFDIRVSVFMNKKKNGYSVLASKLAHCTNLFEFITSYKSFTFM